MSKTDDHLEFAMFSRSEMERRYKRARQLMAQQGIDVLLVTGEENFQYLAGAAASLARHASLTRPSILILPMAEDPIIVTQGRDNLTLGCCVTDIRDYTEILSFPHNIVLDALAGTAPSRVGAELGHEQRMGIPVGAYLDLVAALDRAQFVDASDIFIKLRMIKSDEELNCMRQAAAVTGRARQRLFDRVRPGMTELQVARLMRQLVLEEGGDDVSFVVLQLDAPGARNLYKYDRPLERGTILAIDAGAYVGMHTIDYPRMAVLGRATAQQKLVHRKVLAANRKMADALKPGITCAEMFQIGVHAIQESAIGLPPNLEGRMGHGQGLLITEPPSIAAGDDTRLEPGMVVSTEPYLRYGDVQFLWEDVHVVTEGGHEQLTTETDELREIDL